MRILAGVLLGLFLLPIAAHAHSTKVGDVGIGHAWAAISSQKTTDSGSSIDVYLPLLNNGTEAEALVGAETPLSQKVIIVVRVGGREMTLEPTLALPPGKPVSFSPTGRFLRLQGLAVPVKVGEHIPLTLQFKHAGEGKIEIYVEEKASD